MTVRKILSLTTLFAIIALTGILSWLLATENGARFVLGKAEPYLPEELSLGKIRGSLIGGINLASLDWNSETEDVALADIFIEVELAQLLSRHLVVRSLDVAEVNIVSHASSDPGVEVEPPSVELPLRISIDSSSFRNLTFTREDVSHGIDDIHMSGSMNESRLNVEKLMVRSSWFEADLSGRITVAGDYPGRIRLQWKWRTSPSLELVGQLEIQGDLRRYDFEHTLRLPQEITTAGQFSYVDDAFEFDVSNNWASLEWPLGVSFLSSTGGTLKLQGNPSSINVTLDTRASVDDFPETQIKLEGVLDPDKIRMTRLTGASDLGRLEASGDVRWQPAPGFDVAYSLEGLDPSLASDLLAGQVNVRGIATGEWVAGIPEATIVIGSLAGRINDRPLGGGATLGYSGEQFSVSRGRVQLGENRLGFDGTLGDRLSLDAQAAFPAVGEFLPDAAGSLTANVSLRGSMERPEGRLEIDGDGLSWSDYAIADLSVDASVSHSGDLAARVEIADATIGESEIDAVNLEATGRIDGHTVRAEVRAIGNRIVAETDGAYADSQWTGVVESLLVDNPVAGAWSLREPADLVVSPDVLSVSRACFDRSIDPGQACIRSAVTRDQPTTVEVTIRELPIASLPLGLPAALAPSGFVEVRVEGAVMEDRLTGEGSVSLRDARIDAAVDGETISAAFTRADADFSLLDNRAVASLQLELADGVGGATLDLTIGDVVDTESTIAGRGSVKINNFSLIAALLPDISNPRGIIEGSAYISGNLGAPEFSGSLAMSDGGFSFRRTGIEILDINASVAQLSPGRLRLEGSARSGNGEISIVGDTIASVDAGIRSEFLIEGNDFELSRLPDWKVAASPSIAVVFDDRVTRVTGDLSIPTTDVRLRTIPDTAATPSPDAVVHRGEGSKVAARRRIDVDVAVGLGDAVRFTGFGLSTGIGGTLRIRGGTHAPYTGSGRLSLRDGRYEAYGQQLEIERGQLIFNGPLDAPQLDVRAVRRMTDVTAGIDLSGTPSQLQSTLFSEPPMGDAETLSYLLTGRPLSSATIARSGNTLNAAAFALGVSSAGNIVSQVKTGLGFDTLTVEGGADDGRLIAGKRIGSRLFVEYGYGLIDELGTLLLRYQLNDRVVLESRTGTVSNFDILYSVKKE